MCQYCLSCSVPVSYQILRIIVRLADIILSSRNAILWVWQHNHLHHHGCDDLSRALEVRPADITSWKRVGKIARWVEALAAEPDDLSPIPMTHRVDRENQLPRVALWPPPGKVLQHEAQSLSESDYHYYIKFSKTFLFVCLSMMFTTLLMMTFLLPTIHLNVPLKPIWSLIIFQTFSLMALRLFALIYDMAVGLVSAVHYSLLPFWYANEGVWMGSNKTLFVKTGRLAAFGPEKWLSKLLLQ